jgi:hypothetical protein
MITKGIISTEYSSRLMGIVDDNVIALGFFSFGLGKFFAP